MVDIVQSNKNKLLIRKIGYSAGLESTIERVNYLVDTYVEEGQITDLIWRGVVKNGYNRSETQKKHFENFFDVLGILSVSSSRPIPLLVLDVLAMLRRYYKEDDKKYAASSKAVFLYALTIADGELMGALLNTSFKSVRYCQALTSYREEKLNIFYEKYLSPADKEKLYKIINFEEMPSLASKGSISKSRFERAPPFSSSTKRKGKVDPYSFEVSLSEDWYRKVPNHRKRWCEDLGLYEEGGVTDSGERYLNSLRPSVPELSGNSVIVMPLDIEMMSNNTSWLLGDEMKMSFNKLLSGIVSSYVDKNIDELPADFIISDLLRFCFDSYTKADVRFVRLRRELPYNIFALFCMGVCVSENMLYQDIDKVLLDSDKRKTLYQMRASRKSLWGITAKKV